MRNEKRGEYFQQKAIREGEEQKRKDKLESAKIQAAHDAPNGQLTKGQELELVYRSSPQQQEIRLMTDLLRTIVNRRNGKNR